MYVAMWRARVADPARRAEVADRIETGAMSGVQEISGFLSGFVVILGDDEVMCIGQFADAAGSRAAAEHLLAWAPRHLADLLTGQGEVAVGEVRARW